MRRAFSAAVLPPLLALVAPAAAAATIGFGTPASVPASYWMGGSDYSISAGDFNADGNLDLAATGQSGGVVAIYPGTGAGAFGAPQEIRNASDDPVSVGAGDFDNDGKSDVATANQGGNNLKVFLHDPIGGSFTSGTAYAAPSQTNGVTVARVNADDFPDLVVTSGNAASGQSGGNVRVFYNVVGSGGQPTGAFSGGTPIDLGSGEHPLDSAVADFDGDGRADIATANFTSRISVLLTGGDAAFDPPVTATVPTPDGMSASALRTQSIAAGDLNEDGAPDIVVTIPTSSGNPDLAVFINNGTGGFSARAGSPFETGGDYALGVAVADFDADGHKDVALVNQNSNSVSVLSGDGSGGLTPATGSPFAAGTDSNHGNSPYDLDIGDFNKDCRPDIATVNNGGSYDLSVLLGTGGPGCQSAGPTNTTAPTVPTNQVVNLPAQADRGMWTGNPTSYAYQWQRCDADGTSNCADIAGATNDTYTPTTSDLGRTLAVRVTATNASGTSGPVTSASSGVVHRVNVTGNASPAEGATVTASSPDPDAVCGGNSCAVPYGATVTLSASASANWVLGSWSGACDEQSGANCLAHAGSTDKTATIQAKPLPVATKPPTVPTNQVPNLPAQADRGVWTGNPTSYAYQWLRCDPSCAEIPGETGVTYTPVLADLGTKLAIRVVATNDNGASAPVTSAQSDPVHLVKVQGLADPGSRGSVTAESTAAGADCSAGSSCLVSYGGTVKLTAVGSPGFTFDHWSGACSGSTISCTAQGGTDTVTATASFVRVPPPQTRAASPVGTRGATLRAAAMTSLRPGDEAAYRFEWGPTTSYGQSESPVRLTSGGTGLSLDLGGLQPSTTYHYRVVEDDVAGTQEGADQTFTTLPAAPPLTGSETQLAPAGAGSPSVAALPSGYVAAWVYGGAAYARIFDKTGAPSGSAFRVDDSQGTVARVAVVAASSARDATFASPGGPVPNPYDFRVVWMNALGNGEGYIATRPARSSDGTLGIPNTIAVAGADPTAALSASGGVSRYALAWTTLPQNGRPDVVYAYGVFSGGTSDQVYGPYERSWGEHPSIALNAKTAKLSLAWDVGVDWLQGGNASPRVYVGYDFSTQTGTGSISCLASADGSEPSLMADGDPWSNGQLVESGFAYSTANGDGSSSGSDPASRAIDQSGGLCGVTSARVPARDRFGDQTGVLLLPLRQTDVHEVQSYPLGTALLWQSADEDGDGAGLFGQRFDAYGKPIGGEFRLAGTTAGDQSELGAATEAADDAGGTGFSVMTVWKNGANGLTAKLVAFEPGPYAQTGDADPTRTEATLRGVVNTYGRPATYRFELERGRSGGCPTAFSQTCPDALARASDPQPLTSAGATAVSATFAGLDRDTTYSYRVVATDANGNTVRGPIRLFKTGANRAPVCSAPDPKDLSGSFVSLRRGQSATVPLHCTDADGDPITRSVDDPWAGAPDSQKFARFSAVDDFGEQVTVTLTTSAAPGSVGAFTFRASDGIDSSDPVRVEIRVPANAPPTCTARPTYATGPDTAVTIPASCADPDSDSVRVKAAATHGVVSPSIDFPSPNSLSNFKFTPAKGYAGEATVTLTPSDDQSTGASTSITVFVVGLWGASTQTSAAMDGVTGAADVPADGSTLDAQAVYEGKLAKVTVIGRTVKRGLRKGRVKFTVKFSKRAQKAFRRKKSVKIGLIVRVAPPNARVIVLKQKIVLKRAAKKKRR